MKNKYYLLVNEKIKSTNDIYEWGRWFEDSDNRRISLTNIGNILVSTVFLGIDHGPNSDEPVLFETMVFGGLLDQECDRYTTLKQAQRGHDLMVARVKGEVE